MFSLYLVTVSFQYLCICRGRKHGDRQDACWKLVPDAYRPDDSESEDHVQDCSLRLETGFHGRGGARAAVSLSGSGASPPVSVGVPRGVEPDGRLAAGAVRRVAWINSTSYEVDENII